MLIRNKLKILCVSFIILAILVSFKNKREFCSPDNYEVTCIHFVVGYSIIEPANFTVSNLTDTFPIYYYSNYILYQLPYTILQQNEKDSVINSKRSYRYFLFQRGGKKGCLFESIVGKEKGREFPVDSFLADRAYYPLQLDSTHINYDHLDEAKFDSATQNLTERYTVKDKYRGKYFDTSYYYYSNKTEIQFSLSHQLDSAKNMKLYKVRFVFAKNFLKENNRIIPRREYFYELYPFKLADPVQIKNEYQKLIELSQL